MTEPPTTVLTPPLRIFVVENHPDTLLYLQMYLEGDGHTVLTARSRQEALAAIPEARCAVLISDIGLEDGNGWDLLRALTAQGKAPTYAIAMSGFCMQEDHKRSVEAGFRHHLIKPFKPDEFDALLREAALEMHAAA